MSTYTFTQVGMTCDQCGRHEEWPSFKEAHDNGWHLSAQGILDDGDYCPACVKQLDS